MERYRLFGDMASTKIPVLELVVECEHQLSSAQLDVYIRTLRMASAYKRTWEDPLPDEMQYMSCFGDCNDTIDRPNAPKPKKYKAIDRNEYGRPQITVSV